MEGVPVEEIRPPNGENLYDFRKRIKSFLIDLSKKEGNILVSAHKGVNIAIINFIQNWDTLEFKSLEQNYACIDVLTFDKNRWNILILNDTTYLNTK